MPRIYYLVPDYDRPSWGVGLLYEHVRLLRELGHDARILHQGDRSELGWIEPDVPVESIGSLERPPSEEEVLVVPEVLAAEAAELPWRCRRGVFVQNSFVIHDCLGDAGDYPGLGYSFALAVLPHVACIVRRHFGLDPQVVPPFVAPYFFREPDDIRRERRNRTVLVTVKHEYREAGIPDNEIFRTVVDRRLATGSADWEVVELTGLRHRDVAELMAGAPFLVNLNSHEAFNTTVPEAMAAGCLPVCFDAFGGLDFLVDGDNAFVFPNHHVYPLVEKVLDLLDGGAESEEQLLAMRLRARATAGRFTEDRTQEVLRRIFAPGAGIVSVPPA